MSLDSFLPRIQSVFYAVFDVQQGPKIVYQVPEGLIAVQEAVVSPASPVDFHRDRSARSVSTHPVLFHFDDISKYVIPHSQLCGRLVTFSTKNHRVIGFPVELLGVYMRNYFRYNLCFVFDSFADLSCYEPIVRKVSRVLTSCEKESGFLSNPKTSAAIHPILEQLYEDLNSYSETSITIDRFNSIELKLFPFYPNPPPVDDWMVPIALINVAKRIEDNWDLTMVKVCKFIDGTNHVGRIAHLADCDIALTRQAISHLLFYQVVMTIDIFQYSNMYTLARSIQWLADEAHVRDECGPYVTRPGHAIPDWPLLLRLYSRFRPGKTVLEWMRSHDVHRLGIDVRRFTSFGVIKGFLRRVHRWPVLSQDPSQLQALDLPLPTPAFERRRGNTLSAGTHFRYQTYISSPLLSDHSSSYLASQHTPLFRGRSSTIFDQSGPDIGSTIPATPHDPDSNGHQSTVAPAAVPTSATQRARRASAVEKVLEQLRSRDLQKSSGSSGSILSSPRMSWNPPQPKDEGATTGAVVQDVHGNRSRRQSLISPTGPPPSPVSSKPVALPPPGTIAVRQRPTWTPSTTQVGNTGVSSYPNELLPLLDGEHHTDELAVRFEAGWPILEKWLVAAGGGTGDGDFGRIRIIYR